MKNYIIDPADLENLDEEVARKFLHRIKLLRKGAVLPARKYTVKNMLGIVKYTYTLTHDVINYGKVNTTTVTSDNEDALKMFLQPQYIGRHFHAGNQFLACNNQYYYINTNKSVVVRKHYENIVCDVINKNDWLGSGASARVYGIAGSLKYRYGETKRLVYEQDQGQRAVSLRSDKRHRGEAYQQSVKNEYAAMQSCSRLKPRLPFFYKTRNGEDIAGISMQRCQGIQLFQLICNDTTRLSVLTVEQRLTLCIELLKQLKLRFHQKGYMHGDIKPGNIEVKYDNIYGWQVNIIDFDTTKSCNATEIEDKIAFSPHYSGPEIFQNGKNQSSDLYAMALIFAELFGDRYQQNLLLIYKSADILQRRKINNWVIAFDMFHQIPELNDSLRFSLVDILTKMTSIDVNKRPDIDICISNLETIYLNYRLLKISPCHHDMINQSHYLATKDRACLETMAMLPITDTQSILKLHDILLEKYADVTDNKFAIAEYTTTLGIKGLTGINLKQPLINKINRVTNDFISACEHTVELRDQLSEILAAIPQEIMNEHVLKLQDLRQQINEVNDFITNIYLSSLDFDEVERQGAHVERKNNKIEQAMVYFEKLRMPKKDGCVSTAIRL